ncbi:hypothetical protein MIND_00051200 [Mycena indigotica]|uniref:Uncharacterized protein n=1 Tax=Mycena indigotica TaxID=2126181 RepID=A0A8H6TDE1_9AGAR|nr:uncharacterized protein MIND_00051200 [Mycena indigotica]KAF7315366.1 hypothetical protein MIND_00051200 [Mycena indigotica]
MLALSAPPAITDTIEEPIYPSVPEGPILRASQIAQTIPSFSQPTSPTTFTQKELAFIITTALFGLVVLLLVIGSGCWIWRRRRNRPRFAFGEARDFDDSSWGTIKHLEATPQQQEPTSPDLKYSLSLTLDQSSPASTELSNIMKQFEQRLQREEMDIACALDIAFGDERCCAPFFAGCEEDVTTMLALQAGMESVGKRGHVVRNRARQGSDASTSTQETTLTLDGFQCSNNSSVTTMSTILSDVDEYEEEEVVVYEVKRARAESMEMEKGRLVSWAPVTLLVTGASSTTLETTPSVVEDLIDAFPAVPRAM